MYVFVVFQQKSTMISSFHFSPAVPFYIPDNIISYWQLKIPQDLQIPNLNFCTSFSCSTTTDG